MLTFASNHYMLKHIFLGFALLYCCAGTAQTHDLPPLQNGDLLFQDMDCGPICNAIEEVTEGFDGHDFSHIGLVTIQKDSTFIIEAIGKDVHLTPLAAFLSRSGNKVYVGRIKQAYQPLVQKAVKVALRYKGIPYDDVFIYNNKKYYCSEMIYDAFKKANGNKPFFALEPMTFRIPGSDAYYPVWVSYYADLKMDIPEGKPGINPGGISRSSKITILNK